MGTGVIDKDTLRTNAFNNIFSYIDNRTYVKDPRSPTAIYTRPFVFDYDPLEKGLDFKDTPYIVLQFPNLVYTRTSTDGKHKDVDWTLAVTVRTLSDGAGNSRPGAGRVDMLSITDDLHALFNSEARKEELRLLNIFKLNLSETGSDMVSIDNKMMFETNYELKFMTRLKVSD